MCTATPDAGFKPPHPSLSSKSFMIAHHTHTLLAIAPLRCFHDSRGPLSAAQLLDRHAHVVQATHQRLPLYSVCAAFWCAHMGFCSTKAFFGLRYIRPWWWLQHSRQSTQWRMQAPTVAQPTVKGCPAALLWGVNYISPGLLLIAHPRQRLSRSVEQVSNPGPGRKAHQGTGELPGWIDGSYRSKGCHWVSARVLFGCRFLQGSAL